MFFFKIETIFDITNFWENCIQTEIEHVLWAISKLPALFFFFLKNNLIIIVKQIVWETQKWH